jgi:hypothetical protein
MFHPDQRYDMRLLQQHDLQIEAARMRLAAQAGAATSQRPGRADATLRRLALELGRWLRLTSISRAHTSKG